MLTPSLQVNHLYRDLAGDTPRRSAVRSSGDALDVMSNVEPEQGSGSGSEFEPGAAPEDEDSAEEEEAQMEVDEEETTRKKRGSKPQIRRSDIVAARTHEEASSAHKRKDPPAPTETAGFDG